MPNPIRIDPPIAGHGVTLVFDEPIHRDAFKMDDVQIIDGSVECFGPDALRTANYIAMGYDPYWEIR